jgi:membrane protein implicated in regulation of membrane protease activity
VIAVPIHPDAVGLRFLGRFTGCCATLRGTDYVHTTPLPPGPSSGTLRYAVGSLETLTLPARLPVESFTMMVPTGVTVGTDRLELSGEIESQGNLYDVYTTEGLAAGDVVEVRLRGLPVPAVATWPLALAAVAALAGAGAAAVWWRRRRRSPARATREPERSPVPAGRTGPAPVAELDAELLVDEIALLDVGYAEGRLARGPYERLRAVRKAELLALSSTEEDGPWS